jgi:hypothetical protein
MTQFVSQEKENINMNWNWSYFVEGFFVGLVIIAICELTFKRKGD